MSLLNYESLFVLTDKIENARCVNIVPYTYNDNKYGNKSEAEDKHVEFLQKIKAAGKSFHRFEDNNSITAYVCFTRKNEDMEDFRASICTLGASLYKNLSYLKEPLNFVLIDHMDYARDFISGLVLAHYKYNFLNKEPKKVEDISILSPYTEFVTIYNAQNFVRFLGDTPANLMTPTLFSEYALKYCSGLDIQVLDKSFMVDNKMNLLLGVARGSAEEPKLLKIKYTGNTNNNVDVSLIGKGITFDTGGISIKPSANMAAMKGDMLGAATVLATIKLVHTFKLNINVEAIIPLTENMPGGRATKPGDVHVGMSGISVEIDNTDAEGRLILGDALTLAQKSNPEYLFDIATLTGAISVALGEDFVGYFSNDDTLSNVIHDAGTNAGDPAWRMPLNSLFLSFMKSNVADLTNSGGRKGGSCTAAIFLREFVEKNVKWTHFDIAGVDFDHRNKTVYGKGMTGRGLPLLFEVVKKLSK